MITGYLVVSLFFSCGIYASNNVALRSDKHDTWQTWCPCFKTDPLKIDIQQEIVFDEEEKSKKAIQDVMELLKDCKEVYFWNFERYSFTQNFDQSGSFVRNIKVDDRTIVSAQFLEKSNGSFFNVVIFNSKVQDLLDPYDALGLSLSSLVQKIEEFEKEKRPDLSGKLKDRAISIQTASGKYYCARGPEETMISIWPEDQFHQACKYR